MHKSQLNKYTNFRINLAKENISFRERKYSKLFEIRIKIFKENFLTINYMDNNIVNSYQNTNLETNGNSNSNSNLNSEFVNKNTNSNINSLIINQVGNKNTNGNVNSLNQNSNINGNGNRIINTNLNVDRYAKVYKEGEVYNKGDIVAVENVNGTGYTFYKNKVHENQVPPRSADGSVDNCDWEYLVGASDNINNIFPSPHESLLSADCIERTLNGTPVTAKWAKNTEYQENNTVFVTENKVKVYYICNIAHTSSNDTKPISSEEGISTPLSQDVYWTKLTKIYMFTVGPEDKDDQKQQVGGIDNYFYVSRYEPQRRYIFNQLVERGGKVYVALETVPAASTQEDIENVSPGENSRYWREFRLVDRTVLYRTLFGLTSNWIIATFMVVIVMIARFLFGTRIEPEKIRMNKLKKVRQAFSDLFMNSKLYSVIETTNIAPVVSQSARRFPSMVL